MQKFNEDEMVCTCYEEVSSVVFIPKSGQLIFNIKKVTLGPDEEEIANGMNTEEAIVPEDANLLETLSSYKVDNGSLNPNVNTTE